MEMRAAVELLIQEGFLPSPDILLDSSFDAPRFLQSLRKKVLTKEKPVVLHKDFFTLLSHNKLLDLNWFEFEKSRAVFEKGKNSHAYATFLEFIQVPSSTSLQTPPSFVEPVPLTIEHDITKQPFLEGVMPTVKVLTTIPKEGKKREVKDFVAYYKHRYEFLKGLLQI